MGDYSSRGFCLNEIAGSGRVQKNFLSGTENVPLEQADACILGIAFDATSSFKKGARFGPRAIMIASEQLENEIPEKTICFSDKIKTHFFGILEYSLPALQENSDCGSAESIQAVCSLSKKMVSETKKIALQSLEKQKLLVCLGGDHSVSNGIFQAISETHGAKSVAIIQLDAHLDLRDSFDGTQLSHASTMKRALDLGFDILQIGIRDHISKEEEETIKKQGLSNKIFPCRTMPKAYYKNKKSAFDKKNFLLDGKIPEKTIKKILSKISAKYAYITIDIDAFDPAFFPGTGTPLPFGLDFSNAQDFLFRLVAHLKNKKTRLLGFDIVETAPQLCGNAKAYNPDNCSSVQTEMNAALLVYKLLLWNFSERFDCE